MKTRETLTGIVGSLALVGTIALGMNGCSYAAQRHLLNLTEAEWGEQSAIRSAKGMINSETGSAKYNIFYRPGFVKAAEDYIESHEQDSTVTE
jgi:hypothetical protein